MGGVHVIWDFMFLFVEFTSYVVTVHDRIFTSYIEVKDIDFIAIMEWEWFQRLVNEGNFIMD